MAIERVPDAETVPAAGGGSGSGPPPGRTGAGPVGAGAAGAVVSPVEIGPELLPPIATARSAVASTEEPEVPLAGALVAKLLLHNTASDPSTAPNAQASDQRIAGSSSRDGSKSAPHSHAGTAKAAAVTSPATTHLMARPIPPPVLVVRVHHTMTATPRPGTAFARSDRTSCGPWRSGPLTTRAQRPEAGRIELDEFGVDLDIDRAAVIDVPPTMIVLPVPAVAQEGHLGLVRSSRRRGSRSRWAPRRARRRATRR